MTCATTIDWVAGLAFFAMGYGACIVVYVCAAALGKFVPPMKGLQ